MAYVLTSKAVRALSGLLRGSPGNTGVALGLSAAVPDEFPLPFAVRWSAKEANWVIWLPNVSGLVLVDGTAATITGVTAAQNLPSGWYTVDGASSASTSVYLVVTVTSSATTAALSTSAGTAATGSTVYNLLAATMATDATTGARSVKQFLASSVTIGGGGSGGGGSLTGYIDFVGDVKYDTSYHQIQQRIDRFDFSTMQTTQGNYVMITGGQAVPLTGG